MEMKIRQIIIKEVTIEATELTLLTKEEYLEAKQRIKPIKTQIWWLRPSNAEEDPYIVADSEDKIAETTWKFGDVELAVRPALRFDTSRTALHVGDTFMFGDNTWTVILEGLALCDDVFEMMGYQGWGPGEPWATPEAWRNYEKSDIKEYLDRVFRRWATTK